MQGDSFFPPPRYPAEGCASTFPTVVEAPGPFVGTVFLDALPYEHVDLSDLYPFGMPANRR